MTRLDIKLCLFVCFFCINGVIVSGERSKPVDRSIAADTALSGEVQSNIFNVISYGARGDGRIDDSQAFNAAWEAACGSSGSVTLLIPKATYRLGPIKFSGPCHHVTSITVDMQGYLKALTQLSKFGTSPWIEIGWVDRLTLTGGGTFDGQGVGAWRFNKCPVDMDCEYLPSNVKFISTTNTVVRGITSLNSKSYHLSLANCRNFHGSAIKISAPSNSPDTDGVHIEHSTGVTITQSVIGTGDDCISIGPGNSHIAITGLTCGPGHGISVGGLGRYHGEGDLTGIVVRNCVLSGTSNGVRIKTWKNSPESTTASNLTFQDIVVNNVANPIIIDQTRCPSSTCLSRGSSRVKLSDVHFKHIRGTSSTLVAVNLACSKDVPCENVTIEDIHLDLATGGHTTRSICKYVTPSFNGTRNPEPCVVNSQ
ncbi:PREDICTED: exopolygalacturonase-like [Nelumbo nucifera]|uniref:Exopolygalacturonase-like n=2 Tax=Nelumbo nucifera TaxID=4432 RepID=A0A822ZUE9_NELNU|nr:PREDICTED: exopolygalacturonase-like [Nelumbo nucifera]DAD46496.1 TPA_asm: hypothetical protein HUJ06_016433 [Nelumbo nucifera]